MMDKTTAETVNEQMQKKLHGAWYTPDGRKRRTPVWPSEGLPSNYLETSGVTDEESPRRFGHGTCLAPDNDTTV